MTFKERFYQVLREKSEDRGWQTAFAEKAGIRQNALSRILTGKTGSPTLESVSAIVDAIGLEAFLGAPTIKRTGPNSPAEAIAGDLVQVPVVSSVGAGTPWAAEGEDARYISVPREYAVSGAVSLRVEGDSMEPTIMRGGFIGVVPFTAPLVEGEMYVVHLPYFGDVVKRVRLGDAAGEIVLISDNPKYPPKHVPLDGHDDLIRGRVIWSVNSYVRQ